MNILVLSLLSISLYSFGTIYQGMVYLKKTPAKQFTSLLIGSSAVSFQLIVTLDQVFEDKIFSLNFFNSASIINCLIVIGLLLFSNKRPLHSIFLVAYPISALSTFGILFFSNNSQSFSPENSGIFIHIILSMIAYSIFTIAAIQAILIQLQDKNLKKRNHTLLLRNLPPLLTMENLLFEMLWSGTIILALAILAGFVFVDNLFAQHLVHKTTLSLLSLAVFTSLLVGRKRYGWRGLKASKWTLWGFLLLMLAFFGSKLVLEWLVK